MTNHDEWGRRLDPNSDSDQTAPEQQAALDRIGEVLADEAVWEPMPAHLKDRVLAEAHATAEQPAEVRAMSSAPSARRRSLRAVAAIGAVAAAIALVVLVLPGGSVQTFDLAGTELTPDATATAEVEPLPAGVAITLEINGLPPAGEGEYYAAWLNGEEGSVGIGSFHWREGGIPIELWSGVDTERYPTLVVTLQQEGEPTVSSGVAVLRGVLVSADR